jgi:hypothetical protein
MKLGRTLGVTALVAVSAAALPSLIAYEGFDYDLTPYTGIDGDPKGITGYNGGYGWSNEWEEVGSNDGGIVSPSETGAHDGTDARTQDLAYTDSNGLSLLTEGRQYRTSFGSRSVVNRSLDLTSVDNSYLVDDGAGGNALGADNTSVWLSFLAQSYNNASGNRWAQLRFSNWRFGRIYDNQGNQGWALEDTVRSQQVWTGSPADEQALLVVRVDFLEGGDRATMWVNPDLGMNPLDADGFSMTSTETGLGTGIEIAGRYSTDFDEVRLGTTYGSVTPVPEPATMLALGGGLVLLASRRRRKA